MFVFWMAVTTSIAVYVVLDGFKTDKANRHLYDMTAFETVKSAIFRFVVSFFVFGLILLVVGGFLSGELSTGGSARYYDTSLPFGGR